MSFPLILGKGHQIQIKAGVPVEHPRPYLPAKGYKEERVLHIALSPPQQLVRYKQSVHLLDDLPLEKGIVGVIKKVKKLGEKELVGASLDPKEIKQKLSPTQDMALYIAVNGYVTTYYPRIREIMMNLDKRGEIDYDEIQDQIHAFYKRLKKANKSRLEIFNEIAGKIHRVTLQDDIYCQIVVSYFVQSCEVFDAITE